jgi:hypothetical protein
MNFLGLKICWTHNAHGLEHLFGEKEIMDVQKDMEGATFE